MYDQKYTLIIQQIEPGYILLNPSDAQRLDLWTGDVCEFFDPDADAYGAARVIINDDVNIGSFVLHESLADSIAASQGMSYSIRKYRKPLNTFLKQIKVGVRDLGLIPHLDVEQLLTTQYHSIKSFLAKQIIFKGLKINYTALGVGLEIIETAPNLKSEEYALAHNVTMELFPMAMTTFNGILLIDASQSMDTVDIPVDASVRQSLNQLHEISRNLPQLEAYISDLERRSIIRRLDAAILCAMLYFSEKVARGRGEKMALIPYSFEALPIEFAINNKASRWLHVTMDSSHGSSEDAAIVLSAALLSKIYGMNRGQTNIGGALLQAKRIIDEMGSTEVQQEHISRPRPVMVIVLSDGEFTVPPNPVRVAKNVFMGMEKVIIHSVGIGDTVDEGVLKRIAELGKGDYFHATDLTNLLNFYSKLAHKFKITT